jgi:hypothetical protein
MSWIALVVLGPERKVISNSSLTQADAAMALLTKSEQVNTVMKIRAIGMAIDTQDLMAQLYDMSDYQTTSESVA